MVFSSFPTCRWKVCFCCPGTESSHPQECIPSNDMDRLKVLSVRPTGQVPGENQAGVCGETCSMWAARLLGADTWPLSFSGAHMQRRRREPIQDSCVKGETYSSKTEAWQRQFRSDFLSQPPRLVGAASPLTLLGLLTCVLLWATVICPQETEILVYQSLKPFDICPLGRS